MTRSLLSNPNTLRRGGFVAVLSLLAFTGCESNNAPLSPHATLPPQAIVADDLKPSLDEYRVAKADLLSVSMSDSTNTGAETTKQTPVEADGSISLPLVTAVSAEGKTIGQLERDIAAAYLKADLLKSPIIKVTVVESQSAFSMLGAVNQPGKFPLVKSDFRLIDALALARDVSDLNSKVAVIIRPNRQVVVPLGLLHKDTERYNLVIRKGDMIVIFPSWEQEQKIKASGVTVAEEESTREDRRAWLVAGLDQVDDRIRELYESGKNPALLAAARAEHIAISNEINASRGTDQATGATTQPAVASRTQQSRQSQTTAQSAPLPAVNAQPITMDDLRADKNDYRIGPNDQLVISVFDLTGPGIETKREIKVTDSGSISMPLIGDLKIAGDTVTETENAIKKAYRDGSFLANAMVMVTVSEARSRSFSILFTHGGGQGGTFAIPQNDFRVVDALAMAKAELAAILAVDVRRGPVENEEKKESRLLRIPVSALLTSDPAYNIVIRAKDTIVVQTREGSNVASAQPALADQRPDVAPASAPAQKGEYYVSGLPRSGVFSLSDRRVNLRQALIAAGFTEDLRGRTLTLVRKNGSADETRRPFAINDIMDDSIGQLALQADDVLMVSDAAAKPVEKSAATPEPAPVPSPAPIAVPAPIATPAPVEVAPQPSPQPASSVVPPSIPEPAKEPTPPALAPTIAPALTPAAAPIAAPKETPPAHTVRLVIGRSRLTLEGETVTYDSLKTTLAALSDRANTAIELAVAGEDVTVGQMSDAMDRVNNLRLELGFKMVNAVGVRKLGSKANEDQK